MLAGRSGWAVGILAGLLGLWSGIALLATILLGAPLPAAVALAGLVVLAGIAVIAIRSRPPDRMQIWRWVRVGLLAGLAATLAYDASRTLLSVADPSPFNPFEAVRVFGLLLTGAAEPSPMTWAVGLTFHLLTGISFGIAYAQFFGAVAQRSTKLALVSGVGWGLFLELFQLTLYPGWLDIRFLDEFRTISFLAHVIYGATLGLGVRRLLRGEGSRTPTDTFSPDPR